MASGYLLVTSASFTGMRFLPILAATGTHAETLVRRQTRRGRSVMCEWQRLSRWAVVAVVLLAEATAGATDSALQRAFTSITYPGAVLTTVYGINGEGAVVGQYQKSDGISHGYVLDRTGFASIDPH